MVTHHGNKIFVPSFGRYEPSWNHRLFLRRQWFSTGNLSCQLGRRIQRENGDVGVPSDLQNFFVNWRINPPMLLKIGLGDHLFERDGVGGPRVDRALLGCIEHFPTNGEFRFPFQQAANKFQLVLMI
jgi:hypothetical protein